MCKTTSEDDRGRLMMHYGVMMDKVRNALAAYRKQGAVVVKWYQDEKGED